MNSTTVASRLNISTKRLRRIVRKLDGFTAVGTGSRYEFTEADVKILSDYLESTEKPTPKKVKLPEEVMDLDIDRPLPVKVAASIWSDPKARAAARTTWADRQAKLKERLAAI